MSNKLRVYQYANCDTCRRAVKWLKEQGRELELLPIMETPPSEAELARLIAQSGLPVDKWFNVAGEAYRELGLKDRLRTMTDEEKIRLLASNGRLIKRPVVTDGKRATVGFRDDAKMVWAGGKD